MFAAPSAHFGLDSLPGLKAGCTVALGLQVDKVLQYLHVLDALANQKRE